MVVVTADTLLVNAGTHRMCRRSSCIALCAVQVRAQVPSCNTLRWQEQDVMHCEALARALLCLHSTLEALSTRDSWTGSSSTVHARCACKALVTRCACKALRLQSAAPAKSKHPRCACKALVTRSGRPLRIQGAQKCACSVHRHVAYALAQSLMALRVGCSGTRD